MSKKRFQLLNLTGKQKGTLSLRAKRRLEKTRIKGLKASRRKPVIANVATKSKWPKPFNQHTATYKVGKVPPLPVEYHRKLDKG